MPSSPAHERWEIAKFYCSGEVTQSKERMGTPGELDMLQVTLAVPWQHLWGTVVTGVRSCAALCLHTHLSSWGNYSQKRKGSRCLWESQHYPTCLNTSLKHSPEPSEVTRRKRGFLLHKLLFHFFFFFNILNWCKVKWGHHWEEQSVPPPEALMCLLDNTKATSLSLWSDIDSRSQTFIFSLLQ